MLIATGTLNRQSLGGKNVLVTGAGGGIGFEAARSLIWLGAKVVIGEINARTGKDAAEQLNREFGPGSAIFIQSDIGDEHSVKRLAEQANRALGKIDIVLNNATIAPLGAVKDLSIQEWDASYRVNLRGPVLLARAFLPGMIQRRCGVFACVSSTGMGYMAAYESMKAAQVHMANTLMSELEGTGVLAYTIGPGFVPTQTASSSIPRLAQMMGKDPQEILAAVKGATISVEAAGAGFAASIVLAERYQGLEISSMAALMDAGIDVTAGSGQESQGRSLSPETLAQIQRLAHSVRTTLAEQSAGWKHRSIFEQQWLIRQFKQHAGRPVEHWLELLNNLEGFAARGDSSTVLALRAPLSALANYYHQLGESAKGYIKDPAQREEQLGIVRGWQAECEQLGALLKE